MPGRNDNREFARALGNAALVIVCTALLLGAIEFVVKPIISHGQDHRIGQVKQNIHTIQMAIERYAVDHDGTYPYFLYGGELNFNIGTINGVNTQHVWTPYSSGEIRQPYDSFWLESGGTSYGDASWQMLEQWQAVPEFDSIAFGDALQLDGYMPSYPRNPFQRGEAGVYGDKALGSSLEDHACFGGRDGELSWNLAWFGEAPQLIFHDVPEPDPVRIEYEGGFAFLPKWSDDATNSGHLYYQMELAGAGDVLPERIRPPLGKEDMSNVMSLDVSGYDLLGFGGPRTKGQDIDDSILGSGGSHYWRTGYLDFQPRRNPWVTEGLWKGKVEVQAFDPRPFNDGIEDFVIIHVGAGMDRQTPSARE